jgi:hypothetical protein
MAEVRITTTNGGLPELNPVWCPIAKGIIGNVLQITTLVTLHKPENAPSQNWSAGVKSYLKGFNVWLRRAGSVAAEGDAPGKPGSGDNQVGSVALVDDQRGYVDASLWDVMFAGAGAAANARNASPRVARPVMNGRLRTGELSKVCMEIVQTGVVLQQLRNKAASNQLQKYMRAAASPAAASPTPGQNAAVFRAYRLNCTNLFQSLPDPSIVPIAEHPTFWPHVQSLHQNALAVANIFPEVRPSLAERLAQQQHVNSIEASAHLQAKKYYKQFAARHLQQDGGNGVKQAAKVAGDKKMRFKPGITYGSAGHAPVFPFSAKAGDVAFAAFTNDQSKLNDNDQRWMREIVLHMAYTFPQKQQIRTFSATLDGNNAPERYAMLHREHGLLAKFGLLFDLEVPLAGNIIGDGDRLCVSPVWNNGDTGDVINWITVNQAGRPARAKSSPVMDMLDERGFLKLGAQAGGKPLSVVTDFEFATASLAMRNALQDARNWLPASNPAIDFDTVPAFALPDIQSHAPTVHFSGKSDLADAASNLTITQRYLTLENLIAGIRADVKVFDGAGNSRGWYATSKLAVKYGTVQGKRSKKDLERDETYWEIGLTEIRSSDEGNPDLDVVAVTKDELFVFDGSSPSYGATSPETQTLKKVTGPPEGGSPQRRYGWSYLFGARLTLLDGSSLLNLDGAKSIYDDANNPDLVIGGAADPKALFPHRRWQRLAAPLILAPDEGKDSGWWPAENAHRAVVASAEGTHTRAKKESRRFIVPGRITDPKELMLHGLFDPETVHPHRGAFENYVRDKYGSFPISPVMGLATLIPLWDRPQWVELSDSPLPYHPDPMAESLVLIFGRRTGKDLKGWSPLQQPGTSLPFVETFGFYAGSAWPESRVLSLRMRAGERGTSVLTSWNHAGDELTVHVPRGESLRVMLIPSSFDQNRIYQIMRLAEPTTLTQSPELRAVPWTTIPAGASAEDFAIHLAGQSQVSNPSYLDIEHVADLPLVVPKLTIDCGRAPCGSMCGRVEGETGQRLDISVEIDGLSTAETQIEATWEEYFDLPAQSSSMARRSTGALKPGNETHSKQVAQLATPDEAPGAPFLSLAPQPVVVTGTAFHDFKDQKHRFVTYTPTSVSRVLSEHPDVGNADFDSSSFVKSGNLVTLNIPATARPAPPLLNHQRHAIGFVESRTREGLHRTRKMSMRFYFERNRWSSGEGEKLAVVLVNPVSDKDFNENYTMFRFAASFWGADGARLEGHSSVLTPAYLRPENVGRSGSDVVPVVAQDVHGPDIAGKKLNLLLWEPEFDDVENLWRLDLDLVNSSSLSQPQVRLAFATYQSNAIDKMQLSSITLANHVKVPDSRHASVFRDPQDNKTFHVSVKGLGYVGSQQAATCQMIGIIERRESHGAGGEETWIEEGSEFVLQPTLEEGWYHWSATCKTRHSTFWYPYRVRVIERELYMTGKLSQQKSMSPYSDVLYL